jgi:hypothetical protein
MRRRLFMRNMALVGVVAFALVLGTQSAGQADPTRAPRSAGTPVHPLAGVDQFFYAAYLNGEIARFETGFGDSTYHKVHLDNGGSGIQAITGLSEDLFVEITAGQMRMWQVVAGSGGAYHIELAANLGWGWDNTRFLAGVGDVYNDGNPDFVQVRNDQIVLWNVTAGGGLGGPVLLSNGANGITALAGTGDSLVGVLNGELVVWDFISANQLGPARHVSYGADNYRMMAGTGGGIGTNYYFVTVVTGTLRDCSVYPFSGYLDLTCSARDNGWDAVRTIG